MADVGLPQSGAGTQPPPTRPASWLIRLAASRKFQTWAARFPLTRRFVRREGAAMFDLVAGFCHSQILQALVKLDIPQALLTEERTLDLLARDTAIPKDRMQVLLSGGVAIGLIKRRRSGHYALTTRGAALAGVPGLAGMIKHHDVLYRDLADPVAFFRGEVQTELADFWPYVFGAGGATDPAVTATYSQLMADSQALVAEDTLAVTDLNGVSRLMDVGGGTGAFLAAVGTEYPDMPMALFDLPAVAPGAQERFDAAGFSGRVEILSGSFRDDALPKGADMISLVRVLYDHEDHTIARLLQAVYDALPPGGSVLVSEPMTGGAAPQRAGDAYFALYCMAMRTGRARSADQIAQHLRNAGFADIKRPAPRRPFVTSVLVGVKPG